jgi:predicted TIM-barrel fold metal-dependent hydrolase
MIIDAHIHLWDKIDGKRGEEKIHPVRDGIIRIGQQEVQGMPTWFSDCRNPAELALAAFDDAGVDQAVVTQEYLDGNQNKYLLEVKRQYPERFFVHGLIDFTSPLTLKEEFGEVVNKGFKGIKCPAMSFPFLKPPVKLDDPALMSIWKQMYERNMVLSIDLAPGSIQVPEMKRVLKRIPDLKVAIGHFGMAGKRNWMQQIRLAEHKNVYIECGGIIWLYRKEGPPFRTARLKIKQAAKAVGAEKLMWGSDYPRTMVDFTYRQSLDFVRYGCDFLTKEERDLFLGGNAARLYGLDYSEQKKTPRALITEI